MELLGSPTRTLISTVAFTAVVVVLATAAYMSAGWSLAAPARKPCAGRTAY